MRARRQPSAAAITRHPGSRRTCGGYPGSAADNFLAADPGSARRERRLAGM